jgi:asparagine synthase (glutamine-hydrolysing)
MCAIIGLQKSNNQKVELDDIESLASTLQHRSPDGHGHFINQSIGLYHGRLAIHDLSNDGKQPFATPEGVHAIVNGEIYNYPELKDLLARENQDLRWQSSSDCEVIPYLYQKYGFDFVEHLRGMYALAIYDPQQELLVLSRDPFGMKQLYYYQDDTGFYFASEPRALAHHLNLSDINYKVLEEIAELHFDTDRDTAIAGIQRLLPGETISVIQGKIKARGYYPSKLGFKQKRIVRKNAKTYLTEFDAVFEDTIKQHLQSDVPVGLFLSGGIDSTCILAMVNRLINKPIHTYTIGFKSNDTHDERNIAAQLAKQFNTQHQEIEFTEDDFWELLPQAIQATDDPTADYAIVPTYKLAKEATKDVTVVLSGEGGDEIFAGYGRYRSFTRPIWQKRRNFYMKGDLSRLNLLKQSGKHWQQQIKEIKKSCLKQGYDRLYTAQTIDMQTWLPNDLLIKLDRCLMWHSLEGRTPFLDKAMAEFALTLPNKYKIHGKLGKWILRQWLDKNVKDYDAFSHKKGFTVPIQSWLEHRRSWLQDYLPQQPIVQELCNIKTLQKILQSPLNKLSAKACWSLLYIALWTETHHCHALV